MTIPSDFRSSLLGFSDAELGELESGAQLIHRLFPFDRFIDLIRTGTVVLVKPKRWEDPYENLMNREILESDTGKTLRVPHYEENLFGQCWSLMYESDAMWRIYSSDKRGILVSANAHALFSTKQLYFGHPLEQLYLGKVRYLSEHHLSALFESPTFLKEVMTAGMHTPGSAKTLLFKRDSFDHEREARWILSRYVSEVAGDTVSIPIDLSAAITKVTLDPRLNDAEQDRLSFIIRSAGYAGLLERSNLYTTPKVSLSIPNLAWLHAPDA